jgi:prolyl-tRNA editing enzyme YbaK/EbsC (Cys-tRNA(Pro) deacylase)
MIIENTLAPKEEDVPNTKEPLKSRYFAVLLQYCTKLEMERLSKQLRALALEAYGQEQAPSYKLKMAEQEESYRLTGYGFNAVTPFGTTYEIPLIVSRNIEKMRSRDVFRAVWLGGGDVDLKVRVFMNQLLNKYQPALFVIDCTSDRDDYENDEE